MGWWPFCTLESQRLLSILVESQCADCAGCCAGSRTLVGSATPIVCIQLVGTSVGEPGEVILGTKRAIPPQMTTGASQRGPIHGRLSPSVLVHSVRHSVADWLASSHLCIESSEGCLSVWVKPAACIPLRTG